MKKGKEYDNYLRQALTKAEKIQQNLPNMNLLEQLQAVRDLINWDNKQKERFEPKIIEISAKDIKLSDDSE
jgi:hypothetical protein